jgi:hypothetical protein
MRLITFSTALALWVLAAGIAAAQANNDEKQEFALTAGELSGTNPSFPGNTITLGAGVAVEANYARKIRDYQWGALYWEVDALGGPLRYLSAVPSSHPLRSVFAAPGVKMQFLPTERWSPWIAGGGGYAFYSASLPGTTLYTDTYAVDFGAGVDYAVRPHLAIRGDMRGYFTGGPDLGIGRTSGQFNFSIGGGVVWKFK